MVVETEAQLGPIDLLVANAGIMTSEPEGGWAADPDEWWSVFEVNVRGVYLTDRAVIPGMLARGRGRIVNVASGAAYLPGSPGSAYGGSKAAVHRMSEVLANQLRDTPVRVFSISPGLVRTALTEPYFSDDAPWTPDECAPRLVHRIATGRARRARRPLPPRRARRPGRHRAPRGRDRRERPECDPPAPLAGAIESVSLCCHNSPGVA